MTDTYQAVYDATRSRMSNGDIGAAIEQAIFNLNLSHYLQNAFQSVETSAAEYNRPSAIYRPLISIDGNKWCALYGANLQDGVAGFGDTPADAMCAFDLAWLNLRAPKAKENAGE